MKYSTYYREQVSFIPNINACLLLYIYTFVEDMNYLYQLDNVIFAFAFSIGYLLYLILIT